MSYNKQTFKDLWWHLLPIIFELVCNITWNDSFILVSSNRDTNTYNLLWQYALINFNHLATRGLADGDMFQALFSVNK